MKPRFPVTATIVVLAAVMTMIALGVWQLQRKAWKEALIARYAAAAQQEGEVPWPMKPQQVEDALYRRSHFNCAKVVSMTSVSGRSALGDAGLAIVATCRLGLKSEVAVSLGWTLAPKVIEWQGGDVHGVIASGGEGPDGKLRPRLVAYPPVPGLQPLARPDPNDLPNNHLAYAVQWFIFAAIALVIYGIVLARRLAPAPSRR
ncbi:SURF1 family cytochrome oxidase biogenesis protein [Novosphingobium percolationis]|uniref:SURF1 family cytochrome oxidase biogenesis protein n=1 Tax=Novosphingobium percolationis TaxID=2871811 RepID=UPI001CD194B6|nr:SURF1 family cytochrome oxidase biogenesis protein [Novosphingobium percolationis]